MLCTRPSLPRRMLKHQLKNIYICGYSMSTLYLAYLLDSGLTNLEEKGLVSVAACCMFVRVCRFTIQ